MSRLDGFGRFRRFGLFLFAVAVSATSAAAQRASPGVVAEIRIHGNYTTPDADVVAIIGDVIGKPATDALIADVGARLDKSGRFDGVEVRKRYRSIDNPDDILLMVVVDEVAAISDEDLTPGPLKKFRSSGMFMPVLNSEDGYGFTYGMRVSFVDQLGPRSRISFPLTWGGERARRARARVHLARAPAGAREQADLWIARRDGGRRIRAAAVHQDDLGAGKARHEIGQQAFEVGRLVEGGDDDADQKARRRRSLTSSAQCR